MFRKIIVILCLSILCFSGFAYSICEDQVSFDIPDELEVQAGGYKDFKDTFAKSIGREDYDCILQQKGLNSFNPASLDQYCRIMIRRSIDKNSTVLTNEIFRLMFDSYTSTEKKELFEDLFDVIIGGIVVKDFLDYGTCEIGGKFALYLGLVRESTTGNGDVLLYSYMIPCGETLFTIEAAYRLSEEKMFSPAVKKFFDSLVFNIVEDPYLSDINIPGSDQTFLWPDSDPEWIELYSDASEKLKATSSNHLFDRGYFVNLAVLSCEDANPLFKTVVPATLFSNSYKKYQQVVLPGKRLIENRTSNGICSLKYSYHDTSYGSLIYGIWKYFFVDDYNLVVLEFECYEDVLAEVKMIINSFGIEY